MFNGDLSKMRLLVTESNMPLAENIYKWVANILDYEYRNAEQTLRTLHELSHVYNPRDFPTREYGMFGEKYQAFLERIDRINSGLHPALNKASRTEEVTDYEIMIFKQDIESFFDLGRNAFIVTPEREFYSGEIKPRTLGDLRGKNVYVLHWLSTRDGVYDPNEGAIRLFLINHALSKGGAGRIIDTLMEMPYQRQERKDQSRVPISAELMAALTETSVGTTPFNVMTIDLHAPAIQGFFKSPCDNLSSLPFFAYVAEKELESAGIAREDVVAVAADVGAGNRTTAFGKYMRLPEDRIVLSFKFRPEGGGDAKTKGLMGNTGRVAIVPEDMIDTGGTLKSNIMELVKHGVEVVYVVAPHGILSESDMPAEEKLRALNNVEYHTNGTTRKLKFRAIVGDANVVRDEEYARANSDWLTIAPVSFIPAMAIRRTQANESSQFLFNRKFLDIYLDALDVYNMATAVRSGV